MRERILGAVGAALLAGAVRAQAPTRAARVLDAFGEVHRTTVSGARPVSVGDLLPEATTLTTGKESAALLLLPDGHRVRVGAGTRVVLKQLGAEKRFTLQVLSGQIWSLVRKASQPARFEVETESAVAGVTGTFFLVMLEEETRETTVSTSEGSVRVWRPGEDRQAIAVRAGYMARLAQLRLHGTPQLRPPGTPFRPLRAMRHPAGQAQMWRLLQQEGAWALQNGQGAMRLRRAREAELLRHLRGAGMPPPGAGGRRGR